MVKKYSKGVYVQMRMKYLFLVLLPILVFCFPLHAVSKENLDKINALQKELDKSPGDPIALFNLGVLYHDIAAGGDKMTAKNAVECLNKALSLAPNSVTQAYLGSAWTIIARDEINPIAKLDAAGKGINLMDEAVKNDKGCLLCRVIRIENSYELPDILERDKIANEDLKYLMEQYDKNKKLLDSIDYDPANLFLYKALFLSKANKATLARNYALQAKKIVKDNNVKTRIENFLKQYEE
jgi:hypothetical protein